MKFLRAFLLIFCVWSLTPSAARAQRVEVVGLAASFNVSQSWLREPALQLGIYSLQAPDHTRIDDTGNRFSAYTRVRLGERSFFVQPELAYTSASSSRHDLSYPGNGRDPSDPDYQSAYRVPFSYSIRRAEVATLAGWHFTPKFYVLAGPVLALNLRDCFENEPTTPAVYRSLYQAVERAQLLGQVGVGLQVWHLDLGLRYEQSLTPYSRQITYAGQTQGFHQRTNQFIFSAGVLLYDRSRRWRK